MGKEKSSTAASKAVGKTKGAIIGLSIGLALAASAAIAVPLVLVSQGKQTQTIFKVEFDGNGSDQQVETQEVIAGKKVTQPIVNKNNYALKGWFTDGATGTKQWDFNTPVTSNLKLTAQWEELPPTVIVKSITYLGNGGKFIKETEQKDSISTNIVKGKTFGSVAPEIIPTKANYAFTGWFTDAECKNAVKNDTVVNDDLIVYAGYIQQLNTSTVQFITGSGEKLVGRSTLDVEKTKTWADVKELQPFSKKDGYVFEHWSLSKDDPSIEIPDSTPFTTNTALYPCFSEIPTPTDVCSIRFNAEDGQIQGSDKLTVAMPETGDLTWGSIPKPTVTKEGGVFSYWAIKNNGAYEPLTDASILAPTAEGSYFDVYAIFAQEITAPIIRFTNPDEPSGEGKNYVWVGNPEFRAEASEGGTLWSSVPKPQVYKDADGQWNTGFKTEYYFYNWSLSPDQDPDKIVPVPEVITEKELIVYPVFKLKSSIKFKQKNASGDYEDIPNTKLVLNPVRASENEVWGNIVKPTPADRLGEYFIGWIGKFTKDGEYLPISDSTQVSSLYDLNDIRADYSNDCNHIEFLTDAVKDDGTSAGTVDYWGVKNVGISKTESTSWSKINKPAIVTKDEDEKDKGIVFLRWEINMGSDAEPDWKTINDTTKWEIPARESTPYKVRPVIEEKYDMRFNSGEGSFTQGGPAGGEESLKVSSSTKFEDMPKPTVYPPTDTEGVQYIFRYWALDSEGKKPVPNGHVFTSNETIYAIYDKPTISSVVNCKLTSKQIEAGAKITGNSRVAFNHLRSQDITFGQIAKAETEYLGHEVSFWTTSQSEDETEALTGKYDSDKKLPIEVTLYPFFKQVTNYKKVIVKEGQYTIKSGDILYIKVGDKMLSGITTEVEWGSRELLKWEYSEYGTTWNTITASTVMADVNTTQIRPVFSDPVMKRVKLSNNGNSLIKMTQKEWDVEYGTKVSELYKDQIGENAPVWEGSEFVEWQILNADGTFTSITNDMKVESALTLVPRFTGQSEFYESNLAYFFDERQGKKAWASIVDYSGPNLTIRYARDTTKYYIPKSEFNYELHFGIELKQIPDYFMMGCVNFNNGGKKLTIPKGVTSIGKCFLRGCSSFNQEIDLSGCTKTQIFEVGEQFMAGCYSFNHDLDFSWIGTGYGLYIKGCGAFMFDCQNFTSKITFPTFEDEGTTYLSVGFESSDPSEPSATPDAYSLATVNKYAPMYTKGVTTNGRFGANSDVSPYRKTIVA